ncbi:DEAD/DEAH box helicase family protein [Cytobacillus oceanisediminis]|uniref:SNF2-related protein n=1 Tax=Cytobacillus oceanisediminis TaxID=665099 RepID=UPI001C21EDB6|nr:SNF2-related protein [Cytobacillus oceanisediminis]MBU8730764.1 DEAD/DEAH box helicase family protein [Cytobacillus oceanisediminis]
MTTTTAYQSQYYAYELTKKNASDSIGRISQSLISATVDLNPHQVEAALFAFRSPLEKGALLADEVGLGKTIEAGLVLSQLWAERKRNILIIVPPPLRKQWNRELIEKFYIPSIILESKNYNQLVREGNIYPFSQKDQVIIISHPFARNKAQDIQKVPWDLIVIDEAHRLRNVYKKSNKIGRVIRDATAGFPKLLLTATPLQNSIMELYGLMSFIDPYLFGDESSFKKQFGNGTKGMSQHNFIDLKERIKPVCHRTLRRQVTEYVPYTKRIPVLQEFSASEQEWELYEKVSKYLQREDIIALPKSQRTLMTLVVRKILASSSFAISNTLLSLINRLDNILIKETGKNTQDIFMDIDELEDTFDEWGEEDEKEFIEDSSYIDEEYIRKIKNERYELYEYYKLAQSIKENEKGNALLTALSTGFRTMRELQANEKAVVFTESRRTQTYLKEMLELNGYKGKVVIFNGSNNSSDIKSIYEEWLDRHKHDDQITGSRQVDTRAAIVEYFKNEGSIMIATESAAEGINLQFCSLVVNYDLPWNPQRIEQRIGRCHRYGQKHDVVVINFLNRKNAADKRVFELLSNKFSLFNGIFGSSDEVLGSLESGVDFEKRIQIIYQTCRSAEEIQEAFNLLQEELDEKIQEKMMETRKNLLENFDDEVREKLRDQYEQTTIQMSKMERFLWGMSLFEGRSQASFDGETLSFIINDTNEKYQLISQAKKLEEQQSVHYYRLGHPIAEKWIVQAKERHLLQKEIVFNYSSYEGKVSILSELKGKSGWLSLDLLKVSSAEVEEHMIFSAVDSEGNQIDHERCEKLFELPAEEQTEIIISDSIKNTLQDIHNHQKEAILNDIQDKANLFLDRELEKLDKWSKDLKDKLEIELKEIDFEISQLQKDARMTRLVREKLELNKVIREKERKRNEMRRSLYDEQDEIDRQKERLFVDIEKRLEQKISKKQLFIIKWRIK